MSKITSKIIHVNVKICDEKKAELDIVINEQKRKTIITINHGEVVLEYKPP